MSWFRSYLTERGHKVSIDGSISNIRTINAAVPQGSVLGPLLFLVYINDVIHDIDSHIFLFADDTSIFQTGARKRCVIDNLLNEFKWPTIDERRKLQKILTIGKIIIKRFPNYLLQDLPTFYANSRTVRKNTFATPPTKKDYYSKSFVPASVELWNQLPIDIRCINSFKALKKQTQK